LPDAENILFAHIPDEPVEPVEPVVAIVIGLCLITLAVMVLPVVVKKIEENLELFFY